MESDSDEGAEPSDPETPQAEFLWRQLRLAIVEGRVGAKLSQKTVAARLGWSVSKISRIEQGPVSVQPSDVRAMFSLFGASEKVIQTHVDLAQEARRARSWSDFDDVISPEYMNYIGQEQAAARIYKYETGLVPGLFQTREYSLELFRELEISDERAQRLGEVRQLRQSILDEATGPELTVVVGEVALVRLVGSPGVMRQQIQHLCDLSDNERISLFLMPFAAGAHPGLGTPFTILEFKGENVQPALFLEDGLKQTVPVDKSKIVEQQYSVFERIERKAEQTGPFKKHAHRILTQYYSKES